MKNENKSLVFYILYSLFRSISILILLLTFVLRFAVVDGPSMQNTLHDKDVALITNYYPYFDEISDNEYIPLELKNRREELNQAT